MRGEFLLGAALLCSPLAAVADDYPTQARVEYVLDCMTKHGANYARLYQCSCSIDHVASKLPYDVYVEADTYTRGRSAMGERGGILREGSRADGRREQLQTVVAEAEKKCFLRSAAGPDRTGQ